ncbi:MAG: hypothetical protein LBP64_05490 [Tannerella sp.]|jgi:hypothetical protein|nr:hypothetical protein [Tannerella sp.]
MKKEMDLYSDYLLSGFGQVTVTGLSNLSDGLAGSGSFRMCKKDGSAG